MLLFIFFSFPFNLYEIYFHLHSLVQLLFCSLINKWCSCVPHAKCFVSHKFFFDWNCISGIFVVVVVVVIAHIAKIGKKREKFLWKCISWSMDYIYVWRVKSERVFVSFSPPMCVFLCSQVANEWHFSINDYILSMQISSLNCGHLCGLSYFFFFLNCYSYCCLLYILNTMPC